MSKFARLYNGVVVELFAANPDWPGITMVIVPDTAIEGGTVDGGGNYAAPVAATVNLKAYAAAAQAAKLIAGITVNVAPSGPVVNILCDGTSSTRADLAMLALFGQQSPAGTKVWVDNNGLTSTLTGTQLTTLATAVGTWIDDTYAALGTLLAGIAAASPTVTSSAEIDTAFAAVTA